MTDVVEIAKERRVRLAAEIVKLDEFLRMAEKLVKYTPMKPNKASDTKDAKVVESISPARVQSGSAASVEEA